MNRKVSLLEDESIDDLQLDNLYLIQKKSGFRFGVDAVLLSNFANVKKRHRAIDLCTGTGIVPFLLYGKYKPAEVIGIEIQDMKFLNQLGKFDVLTVNPPYKLNNSGILNPNDKLAIARHEVLCTLEDVIIAARKLLKDNGRMYMVHRPERLIDIFELMRKHKIEPKRVQMIQPNSKKAPNIVLVEGQRDGGAYLKWEAPLYVYNEDGSYSDELNKIYGREV